MKPDPITEEISNRICSHMNSDHMDALILYADYYGGVSNPNEVKMLKITERSIHLLVDNKNLEVEFDHILKDSSDAHQTLVKMIKSIPRSPN